MISTKSKIIMLLPPKTATHSVQNCLQTAGVAYARPVRNPGHPVYHLTIAEIMYVFDLSKADLSEYKIFQVTRNPYDRLVSGWVHQKEIWKKDLSLGEMVARLEKYKWLLPHYADYFYASFYGSLDHKTESFRQRHWGGLRFWMDQMSWKDIDVPVRYFKLEDLTADVSGLAKFLDLNLPDLPKIRVNTGDRSADYMSYYDEALRERAYQLYQDDFKNLGYGPA